MPENIKTAEFLQKLAPCIERGDLDVCVEEAAREMGVGAGELMELSTKEGENGKYSFAYVIAIVATQGLEGEAKAGTYNNAGLSAKYLRKVERAEEQYKLAIAANPNYAEAHSNYAIFLEESKRNTEAEEQYKLAIAANPNLAEVHSNYALLLSKLNQKAESEEEYKLAIAANPNLAVAHYNYALLLSELNRKTEAEEQYKLGIVANPNFAEAHSNYAILLEELNRKTESEEHYKLAIAANPNLAEVYSNYAILLEELNRKTEAEDHYRKAIKANPNYAAAHNNYAHLLREKGMFFDAEKEVRIALQIQPKDPYSFGTYGDILADEDYLEEAIKKYQEAIKNSDIMVAPAKAEIHNNLGWIYAHLEKYDKSKKEFREAHKLDPQNVKVIRNIRALHKVESEPKISNIQWCIAIVLFSGVIATWYLFWTEMITENVFAAQFIILIAMMIFILFYHQFGKFKAGPIEFEKSTEHMNQRTKMIAKFER